MEPLHQVLTRAVDQFKEERQRELSARLEKVDDLSIHERDVISELGPRENWYAELSALGASAFALAQDLSGDHWRSNYLMQDAVDPAEPFFGIPTRGFEIAAARQLIEALPRAQSRASAIVWSALDAQPSPRVRAYMRRLGRCYVFGFDAEVVILCRAILDVALRDVLGDEDSGPTNIYGRIELLRQREDLSPDLITAAHEIRLRGNRAVHEEPAAAGVAEDTIAKTMRVLAALFESFDE